nr:MAG TPA: hypothetical protein [Caudoviricetes sp.]
MVTVPAYCMAQDHTWQQKNRNTVKQRILRLSGG